MKKLSMLKYPFLYAIFSILIAAIWQAYELVVYGVITPKIFDSVITLLLSFSLTTNIFLYDYATGKFKN